jgi:hypothetical protein
MMPADIAQGIAKDAQENLDGLDVVNVPTYGARRRGTSAKQPKGCLKA